MMFVLGAGILITGAMPSGAQAAITAEGLGLNQDASIDDSVGPSPADDFGPNRTMYTDDGNPGGWVYFQTVGDLVQLGDRQEDGAGVELDIWNVTNDPDTYEYGMYAGNGDDTYIYADASMGQPWNMAEGACFRFRIRLVDNGRVIPGSTDTAQWRNVNTDGTDIDCPGVD
ncbi:hypothetical protein ACFS2C_26490 [Prauserella oleivorans]|uniref:Uncharacterized protein n=1 Tax=Prauserella oleivorans TaxID=1478153 RepID=A0ABW5WKI4_9PSEU